MSNLSLDIDYKNIIEWLSQRNKLNSEWPRKLKAGKLKLQQLLEKESYQQIENQEIKEYIEKNLENFNYQNIDYVLKQLIQTEQGKQKTLFGGYSNKIVKEWDSLNKFYKKNNLHIVDLAKIISQNVQFEIPAMNKGIKNSIQSMETSEQKISDSKNTIKELEQNFQKHCEKLGIKGEDINSEVPQMVRQLPQFFQKLVDLLQQDEIKQALDYYYQFTQYVNPKQNMDKIKLNLIEYMNKFGDDSVDIYNLRKDNFEQEITDETILNNNENKYKFYENFGQQKVQSEGIDWSSFQITNTTTTNDASKNQNQSTEINWGITLEQPKENKEQESSGINWGITVDPQPENQQQQQEQVQEIKWDITATDNNNENQNQNQQQENKVTEINWNIETVEKSEEEKEDNQFDQEVLTLISSIETRNLLIQEMSELNAFYHQRCSEADSHSTNSLLQMYNNNEEGENVFEIGHDKVKRFMHVTREILKNLKNYQFRQLLIIKEQPKSQERIIKSLESYQTNIKKQEKNIESLEKKVKSSQETQKQNQLKLKEIGNLTVELKSLVEQNLTEVMKNPVKIIGEINKIKKQQ